jgi:hypothetical protein
MRLKTIIDCIFENVVASLSVACKALWQINNALQTPKNVKFSCVALTFSVCNHPKVTALDTTARLNADYFR